MFKVIEGDFKNNKYSNEEYSFDVDEIVNRKMDQNEKKYPINKAKGKADKYNEL